MGKRVAITPVNQDKGMFGHFCGLDNVQVFLVCVQTCLRNGLVFVLSS